MSLIVFAIAAIPAAVVVGIATATRSRLATSIAALVAALVGIFTGNPTYTVLDLIFVALATYIAWPSPDPATARAKAEAKAARIAYLESPEFKAKEASWNAWMMGVGVAGFLVYLYFQIAPAIAPTPTAPSRATQTSQPQPPPAPPTPAQETVPTDRAQRNTTTTGDATKAKPAKSPFRRCTEIVDDRKMQECLERLK